MARIMERDVNIKDGYIRVGLIKVAKINEDTIEFIDYFGKNKANGHIPDQANIMKVDYFREWLLESQCKTAQEMCKKYL